MSQELILLAGTGAVVGLIHTLMGPDHYLPFIVLAKARKWSVSRTAVVTFLCGLGHVGSSIVIGLAGIALGTALFSLQAIEAFRGEIAAWLLLGFGLAYTVWGIRDPIRNRPHRHLHLHADRDQHLHEHAHVGEHTHVHEKEGPSSWTSLTPWVLFTIFVFGPCEPLIPLVMYPAAQQNMAGVFVVAAVFGAVTVGAMLVVVLGAYFGLSRLATQRFERYSHAMAGSAILLCGLAIKVLGL